MGVERMMDFDNIRSKLIEYLKDKEIDQTIKDEIIAIIDDVEENF
jgi:hypothetical protein